MATGGTYPTVTQDFTLVVSSNTATITSPSSYAFGASKKATINVTTGGTPKGAVSVSGLPAWLHFTAGAGGSSAPASFPARRRRWVASTR